MPNRIANVILALAQEIAAFLEILATPVNNRLRNDRQHKRERIMEAIAIHCLRPWFLRQLY